MNPDLEPPAVTPRLVLELIDVEIMAQRRGRAIVLSNINWRVAAGDYWFLGGLHGSGKSDLLVVAAGITPPRAGQVRLFSADPADARPGQFIPEQLRVGLAFDGGRLLHHLTVEENIALPVAYHNNLPLPAAVEQIKPLLKLVELEECRDYMPSAISRNWQQRAGLARALAMQPELLLLDNPLSSLDPQDAHWWLNLLRQLSLGHPLVGGKPLTLAATGDTVLPWKDQARQFAVLKEGHLHFPRRGPETINDPLWETFAPADLPHS